MKTCVFAQRFYAQNFCEKKVLKSPFLSDGSTENEVFSMQYAVNSFLSYFRKNVLTSLLTRNRFDFKIEP